MDKICDFVQNVEPTFGGDAPECYELVLHQSRSLSWSEDSHKTLVMIGDDIPHAPSRNPKKLNWRTELKALIDQEISVYGVQALNRRHANLFYQELAEKSGGYHLNLDQFAHITDYFLAICYQQSSTNQLQDYEEEIVSQGRMNRSLHKMFNTMFKRENDDFYEEANLNAVSPSRFQVLNVDENVSLKNFVLDNGLTFKRGRGFYEFTKKETIQANKEILLMDKKTGDLFAGDCVRGMLGIPENTKVRIKPTDLKEYTVFVQSNSYNRKLMAETRFLYEVEDWSK